ncbi:MAG: hypothetical protein QNJ36_12530 [Calothrix sp. MO_167.B42]|nr:hypothetical protein [Calothrix sp. MO_167.B42]
METNVKTFTSPGMTDEVLDFVSPSDNEPSTEASEEFVTVGENGVLVVPNIEPPAGADTVGAVGSEATEEVVDFVAPSDNEPSTEVSEEVVTVGEDGTLVVPNIEPPAGADTVGAVGSETTEEVIEFVTPSDTEPSTEVSEEVVTVGEDGGLVVPNIEPPTKTS